MELGKRVLLNISGRPKFKGVIIQIGDIRTSGRRFKIEFFESINPSGKPLQSWYSENSLEIDKEYYREEKINEILRTI
jgi:hypothetical protein